MSKHRVLKPLFLGLATALPISAVVILSVNWDHIQTISCVGSGGVKPFIEKFGDAFIKENTGFDVTVESGGSTFGLGQASSGYCNIANVSKNPYTDIHYVSKINENWTTRKMKTFTLGWEAIGILYKMPEGLSQPAKDAFDLYVNDDNIAYLYAAFSGYNEVKVDGQTVATTSDQTSYYNFLTPAALAAMNESDKNICKGIQIAPVVRSGAATGANTALSFWEESQFEIVDRLTERQHKALFGGQYGDAREIIQTDESNAKGYEAFTREKSKGTMVYLSSAFTETPKTKEIISSNGYKFMSYQPEGKTDIYKYNYDNFAEGYEWVRPLNVCISLDKTNEKYRDVAKFVEFIYGANYTRVLNKDTGAKTLTSEQINSMKDAEGKWAADTDLEESRTGLQALIYGALK